MLAISRILVAWQPLGLAMGVYDMCSRYLQEREQFGVPLASFQASPVCQPTDRSSNCCNFLTSSRPPSRQPVGLSVEQRHLFLLLHHSDDCNPEVCLAVVMPALPSNASLRLAHYAQRCAGCLVPSRCRDRLVLFSKQNKEM